MRGFRNLPRSAPPRPVFVRAGEHGPQSAVPPPTRVVCGESREGRNVHSPPAAGTSCGELLTTAAWIPRPGHGDARHATRSSRPSPRRALRSPPWSPRISSARWRRDAAGPLSDIDVGLLVREGEDHEGVSGRVMDALSRRLRTSALDVVSLADAPLPLRYRAARDGILVLGRDAAAVERFVTQTVLQYLDFKPLRDRAFAQVRAAILEQR